MAPPHLPLARLVAVLTSIGTIAFTPIAAAVDIFLVTNTNDSGAGSLRQALLAAQVDPGPDEDRIVFNIAGGGTKTILPLSQLPTLQGEPITIDGLTQGDSDCTSWPPTLRVEIRGTVAGAADGLRAVGSGHVIQGLVIGGFAGDGIQLVGVAANGDHWIRCNFIGTTPAGNAARPNAQGVFLDNTVGVRVGGDAVSDRNLISGNENSGVSVVGDDNEVQGNFVGTDASATIAIANETGIRVAAGFGNQIGGPFGVGGNVVAGNLEAGIELTGAPTTNTLVVGNWIGVNSALAPNTPTTSASSWETLPPAI